MIPKVNCEPKRRLVCDHIEFTCGIQIIIVHSILDMIYGFVKIIEVIDRGKRLCFCSLLHHPQKVNATGTTNEILSPCFVSLSILRILFLILLIVSNLPSFFFFLFSFFITWSRTLTCFFKPKVLFRIHKNHRHISKKLKKKKKKKA